MKSKFFLVLLCLLSLSIIGCNKNQITDSKNKDTSENKILSSNNSSQKSNTKIEGSSDYVEMVNFFTPVYEKQSAEMPENSASTSSKKSTSSTEKIESAKSENIIPGLRKLSDYITKYSLVQRDKQTPIVSKKYLKDEKADNLVEEYSENNAIILPYIFYFMGGFSEEDEYSYTDVTGALPPFENSFYIRLNTAVSQDYIKENLQVLVNNKLKTFEVKPDYEHKYYRYWYPQNSDEENKLSDSYIVKITEEIGHNKTVYVKLKNPTDIKYTQAVVNAKKDSDVRQLVEKSYSYETLTVFKALEIEENIGSTKGKKNPIRLSFSQIPDKNTIIGNIKFDFDYELTEDNFEINGSDLLIYNLPVEYEERHSLNLKKGLKDIYGQTIASNPFHFSFYVKDEPAQITFLNYGTKILEAKYPHKIVFSHRNVENSSFYTIQKTLNPFVTKSTFIRNSDVIPSDSIPFGNKERNETHYEEIDLDSFLNEDGFGTVKFNALSNLYQYSRWNGTYLDKRTNDLTVQVSDLGVTTRIGINKACVMVRNLSDGKPVSDAEVYFYYTQAEAITTFTSELSFAKGKTDSNGLLVIDFAEKELDKIIHPVTPSGFNASNERNSLVVRVVSGNDQVIFKPSTHDLWRTNVYVNSITRSLLPQQKTFIFVDRGIYRPGETVSWRGIDKDLKLGSYTSAKGKYNIQLKGNWWKAPLIGEQIYGELSETGGFSGSFTLPEDLKPGYYEISYCRGNFQDDNPVTCTFRVSEFEKVKTEVSIDVPDLTYFGGDKLTATVEAKYLAGGVVSNGNYSGNWFTQGHNFTTEIPESKDFYFGPYNSYSGRNHYSSEEKQLSSMGKTNAECNSQSITDGKTYTYRFEAAVTDISNQRITAVKNITVHPAKYYIGLKKAQNVSGFAKKGMNLQFPFILTDTDGKIIPAKDATKLASDLEFVFSREEWSLVHEQSVDDTIYTRYTKKDIVEKTDSFAVSSKGTISFTPEKSGWYTLKVTGKDDSGNTAITSICFYVTGNDAFFHNENNSQSINLTTDKTEYLPGEKAQLLLESPLPSGDYLICVEREGIFTTEVRHIEQSTDVIEIPIAKNYVPVVYVTVSSYSERTVEANNEFGKPDLDKPKQYFGATSLFINPYVRAFSINVQTDKPSYKPGEEAKITLTATKNGKPLENAELTVMAVDRGVLDLINYHVQDPIKFFYSSYNFPDYVQGGDSRAYLMDPVTYSIKNLKGGDSDESKDDERSDFRPTALFEPVIITDKNGKAEITFKLPDNLTTYRITAFGAKDSLFALQEKETKVQNPINVQAVQPRKLRVSDTAECGVLLTNLSGENQKITVSVKPREIQKSTFEDEEAGLKTIPGRVFVDGKDSYTVTVQKGDSSVVYFDIGAEKEGTAELVYTIQAKDFNDKLVSKIKIEKSYIFETQIVSSEATDDENKTTFIIPSEAQDAKGDLQITLDATRLGLLSSSVDYLFEYPYGCLEQQTSKLLPLLLFEDYIDVFGMDKKVTAVSKCIPDNWNTLQLENGAFPYWPGGKNPSFYVSLRVAHLYAIAHSKGYDFNIDFEKLSSYICSNIDKCDDYTKAYACYVMKLNGSDSLNITLHNLYSKVDKLNLSSAAFTGICFALDQDNEMSRRKALNCAEAIKPFLRQNGKSISIIDHPYKSLWNWYNSDSGELATILQLFTLLDSSDQTIDKLLYTLLLEQKKGYWKNTASTARVLEAISTYIKKRNLEETDFTGTASVNSQKVLENQFTGLSSKPVTLTLPFEGEVLSVLQKDTEYPVEFSKTGNGHLYYTLQLKYALPPQMLGNANNGIKVEVEYKDFSTDELLLPSNNNSVLELESGKTYKATVKISSPVDLSYLALRSPIPAGCEILDSELSTGGMIAEDNSRSNRYWSYRYLSNKAIYDSEIQYFWDDFNKGDEEVTFIFRAARRGVYTLPPVFAQCMYEEDINGRGDGWLCTIK